MKVVSVKLSDYPINGQYDFGSRTRGLAVRTGSNIDQLIETQDIVNIIVPREVFTISQSFWKELLGNSIMELGKARFFQRVKFMTEGRYQPERDVQIVVDEISAMCGR